MTDLTYRHNVMEINSLEAFVGIKGGVSNGVRDVYFVRMLGENTSLLSDVTTLDERMYREMKNGMKKYHRINSLPVPTDAKDAEKYGEIYAKWQAEKTIQFTGRSLSPDLEKCMANACTRVVECYTQSKGNASETMIKNLMVKIFYWFDQIDRAVFTNWDDKSNIKIIASNVIKDHEYLFCLFLTFLGCDVLLIQNQKDVTVADALKAFSKEFVIGGFGNGKLGEYNPAVLERKYADMQRAAETNRTMNNINVSAASNTVSGNNMNSGGMNRLVIPEHPGRKKTPAPAAPAAGNIRSGNAPAANQGRREKSFEELAQLAASIVLIAIHDSTGEVIGTGSGIMIGRNGYILTNNHVASGGRFYSVRIEDDDQVYKTGEVIKYNPSTDLAVIRIDRVLDPLPIYNGKDKLVRGQKVVAIGSPLGLFNSVSDGIISGFRKINDVDMIQFTAPISHGSSGGAVLNMYGEVVGISTAGIDSGQNINLAIGYENILPFAGGFMK